MSPCLFVPLLLWVFLYTCVQSPCCYTEEYLTVETRLLGIFLLYFMRIGYCVRFWEEGPNEDVCVCEDVRPYVHEDRSLILVPPLSHKLFFLMDQRELKVWYKCTLILAYFRLKLLVCRDRLLIISYLIFHNYKSGAKKLELSHWLIGMQLSATSYFI